MKYFRNNSKTFAKLSENKLFVLKEEFQHQLCVLQQEEHSYEQELTDGTLLGNIFAYSQPGFV